MGHHINAAGQFQSDRHPDLEPDKVVLSFKDPKARPALERLATAYWGHDDEFAADVVERLRTIAIQRRGL